MSVNYNGDAKPTLAQAGCEMSVKSGILHTKGYYYSATPYAYHPNYRETRYAGWGRDQRVEEYAPISPFPWREPTNDQLFAILECGVEVRIDRYSLSKD